VPDEDPVVIPHIVVAGPLPHKGCDVCDARAALDRLLNALESRYGGTLRGDDCSLHWKPADYDELLAAVTAAEDALKVPDEARYGTCDCGRPLTGIEARMLPVIRERDDARREVKQLRKALALIAASHARSGQHAVDVAIARNALIKGEGTGD
jgi:hypothetical protein